MERKLSGKNLKKKMEKERTRQKYRTSEEGRKGEDEREREHLKQLSTFGQQCHAYTGIFRHLVQTTIDPTICFYPH